MNRKGIAIPLVIVLITGAAVAIFVFQQVVQQEAQGTHKLVRTLHAEAICDRVVNRIAATVGQHPWEDRFYLLDAIARAPGSPTMPEAKYVFDQDRFPFGEEGTEFASGDASFTGSVKDTSAVEQRYRVTVRAKYKGVSVLGVYDLSHARGTMGPLNRSAIDLRKMKVDEAPLDSQLDQEMDAIPTEALKPENVLGPNFPVPQIPAVFPPAGTPPPPSAAEQTAGLVGGKLVPAFNPPAGIAPGTPEAAKVTQATNATTTKAGGRAESDFERARSGQLPPGSVLQPGAAVPPPRKPAGPPPDPSADPFASDPGGYGNDGGTYTPAGWDPSLGGETSYAPDGTEMPADPGYSDNPASSDNPSSDDPNAAYGGESYPPVGDGEDQYASDGTEQPADDSTGEPTGSETGTQPDGEMPADGATPSEEQPAEEAPPEEPPVEEPASEPAGEEEV